MQQNIDDSAVKKEWMTVETAQTKYCPRIERACLGDGCMFWEWREPYYAYQTESPGEGWIMLGDALPWSDKEDKHEWAKPREVDTGKCGCRY
jgi:hypothetical protein